MKKCSLMLLTILLFISSIVQAQTELLGNGNFSNTSSYWKTSGYFQYDSRFSNYNSPYGYAYLADFAGQPANNLYGDLWQDFYVPSNTDAIIIRYWYKITTNETTSTLKNDKCDITIIDPSNSSVIATISSLSNIDKSNYYNMHAFCVSGIPSNKTLRIKFNSTTSSVLPTTFRIDDVSIMSVPTSNCINWAGNNKPAGYIDSAMETLCKIGVIDKNQNISNLNSPISKLELAKLVGKVLFSSSDIAYMDYFPDVFSDLNDYSQEDRRYLKMMLYLEYLQKDLNIGTDGISPYDREHYFVNSSSMKRSYGIRALLEAVNLGQDMAVYDAKSNSTSQFFCDVLKSNKSVPWMTRAHLNGLLDKTITTSCSSGKVYFGADTTFTFENAYVILARIIKKNLLPSGISAEDFYTPNMFFSTNGNQTNSFEKGVFHDYSDNGFNIPGGGLPLEFSFSYHSNLLDLPLLNNDLEQENTSLKNRLEPLGGGWTHNYNMFIKIVSNYSGKATKLIIYWPDGTLHTYSLSTNKFETKGLTDILTIDSTNSIGHPAKITITKGRVKFIYSNIDAVAYTTLSIKKIIDKNGNYLNFDYSKGKSKYSGWEPMLLTKVTDSYSKRFLKYNYNDTTNYLENVADPAGRKIGFVVDRLLHNLTYSTDAKNQKTSYIYYEFGPTTIFPIHLLGIITRPNGNEIRNAYYSRKLKQSQTNNYTINIEYKPNYTLQWKNQTSKVEISKNNHVLSSNYLFDNLGSPVNTITNTSNIIYKYDSENRLIEANDQILKIKTIYRYDTYGYVCAIVTIDSLKKDSIKNETINNKYGEVLWEYDYNDPNYWRKDKQYTYDNNGNLTLIESNPGTGGSVSWDYSYFSKGTLSSIRSPNRVLQEFTYNSYGNVSRIDTRNSYNYTYKKTFQYFGYDTLSRLTSATDENGTVSKIEYDNNDNVTAYIKDPSLLNLKTQYNFDANDNLISIISPKGHKTTFPHDYYTDDLIEENDGTNKKRWKYNEDGSLDSFITKNNDVFKYHYYNENDFPGTKLTGLLRDDDYTFYSYRDDTKNLYMINSNGKAFYIWQRTSFNRPDLFSTQGFFNSGVNNNIGYLFDRKGRVTRLGYPVMNKGNWIMDYTYTYQNELIEEIRNPNNSNILHASYQYRKDGKPLTEHFGNGVDVYYHYDTIGRLDSIWAKNSKKDLLYSIGASLDPKGNHIREDLKIYYKGKLDTSLPKLAPLTSLYKYETRNRIYSSSGKSISSDNAGNISNNSKSKYEWDRYSRLTKVVQNKDSTIYEYDPLGFRRRKNDVYYVVEPYTGQVIMEATKNGNPLSAYIWGNGLVGRIDPNTDSTFYFLYDFRGSVIGITNDKGDLVKFYKYDEWGKVYSEGGKINWINPYQYVGKWGVQKDDSDLYFMKARYYEPSTGRFLSEDPIWNTNLFVYGDDNPVNNIDPTGKIYREIQNKGNQDYLGKANLGHYDVNSKINLSFILPEAYSEARYEVVSRDYNLRNNLGVVSPAFTRAKIGGGIKTYSAQAEILFSLLDLEYSKKINVATFEIQIDAGACAACIGGEGGAGVSSNGFNLNAGASVGVGLRGGINVSRKKKR